MALARPKSEFFHQRYSELSDETRMKNKREERVLEVKLKYYEREKNIRLNILHKEQNQLERIRSSLIEQWKQIQHDKQKQHLPSYISNKSKLNSTVIQLSTPDLFTQNIETTPHTEHIKPIPSRKIIRPHSAG